MEVWLLSQVTKESEKTLLDKEENNKHRKITIYVRGKARFTGEQSVWVHRTLPAEGLCSVECAASHPRTVS